MIIKDGIYFILFTLLLLFIVAVIPYYISVTVFIIFLVYLFFIFYIPKINVSPFPKTFLSPVNGKVVSINEAILEDKEYNEVTISIRPFKSHINIIPMSGKVEKIKATYNINKGNSIESFSEIITEFGNYFIKQISYGFISKMVNNLYREQLVDTGDFFGYIIFKGQLILYIPLNFEILVLANDRLEAGIDVIARLK